MPIAWREDTSEAPRRAAPGERLGRTMTTNPLQQTIEALAKEKGIEPEVIITAIEDAVLTASRKYYKTNENLKTRFNTETGQVDLFAVKHIVQEVSDPATEISLT